MNLEQDGKPVVPDKKSAGFVSLRAFMSAGIVIAPLALVGIGMRGCSKETEALTVAVDTEAQVSLDQKFYGNLERLDFALRTLRNEYAWRAHPEGNPSPEAHREVQVCLSKFEKHAKLIAQDPSFHPLSVDLEKFHAIVKGLPEIQDKIAHGKELTPEEVGALSRTRAYIKLLFVLQDLVQPDVNTQTIPVALKLDTKPKELKPAKDHITRLPVLVDITDAPQSEEAYLDHTISELLLGLWKLSPEGREELTRAMVETEDTKVAKIEQVKEPGFEDPVLHIWVDKHLNLPDGPKTIQLHLRQTIEQRSTTWTALGTTSEGGIVVRNRLVEETPIDDNMSISAYNTCLTYFAGKGEHANKTHVVYTNDQETTFYGHTGMSLRTLIYRNAAKAVTAGTLKEARIETVQKAKVYFGQVVETGKIVRVEPKETELE